MSKILAVLAILFVSASCLTNKEIQDGVLAVKARASSAFGVTSTPTFFINGEEQRGELSIETLDGILAD